MTDTEKKMDRLYNIMEELQAAGRADDAAAMRWGINQIESEQRSIESELQGIRLPESYIKACLEETKDK